MSNLAQINAPFNGVELIIVEYNQQPYTPMRPIVEGMGLAWQAQFDKLKQRFNSVIMEIMTTGKDGKSYKMICLPLRKLFGWLMTISPNKVKPELRDTVIKYQEECDDVLWDYWTKGQAVNPRSTKEEREPLTNAVNLLVAKTKHLNYSDAYKLVHQRFNVKHIDEIPYDAIPVAVEYVHHLIVLFSNQTNQQESLKPWQDQNVQFLMWYVPKLAKIIKNDIYPALTLLRSELSEQVIAITHEALCHANLLNRIALKNGMTHYTKLGGQPLHTFNGF